LTDGVLLNNGFLMQRWEGMAEEVCGAVERSMCHSIMLLTHEFEQGRT
jgi:hypothetical protein